jgi:predicted ATPase/DNA-binding SARP family transcriptional activator
MSTLRLFTLGAPCLERDGVPLEFDTRKNLALVVYLAMTRTSHSRESLITLLWPELEPSRGRAGLRRNLSTLRKALYGEWLVVDRETVGLDPAGEFWLDVDQFRSFASTGKGHDHPQDTLCPECLSALVQAAELYRGDFLTGFSLRDSAAFDEWQFFETESLRRELASVLERLVRGLQKQKEFETAIYYARRWLALDPLHELAHRRLMELYAQSGQQSAALRQYQECERLLQEELGLTPSEETSALYHRIQTGGLEKKPAPRPQHNLPAHPTPFIGREEELSAIGAQLRDPGCRLLTLVGPGGIGKTRLALQAAALAYEARLGRFERGVYYVRLGPLQSAERIVPAVAEAIGFRFREGGEPRQQLLDYLREKNLLLLLDNFEHLLEGIELVTEILQSAPDVMILVTSRVRLNLRGENLFPVEGMETPEPDVLEAAPEYDSVKLFIQRTRQTRIGPDWVPTSQELTAMIRVCRLVEGIPLGILMAAGWMEMLTPAEIAAEIEQGLDILRTDTWDAPARQRSIRAVFDHSWRLLTGGERGLFERLSVFRGGFTREAAQEVAGASLFELRALLGKSFLDSGPAGRYEIHELLRQYGQEKLDHSPEDAHAARDQHSAYFLESLHRWVLDLKGLNQERALEEIETDFENVRAAWDWTVERGSLERIAGAVEGLCLFYQYRARWLEGDAACQAAERLLADVGDPEAKRVSARLLAWQALFNWNWTQQALAGQQLQQSYEALKEPQLAAHDVRSERAMTLWAMGYVAIDLLKKQRLFEESLALFKELDDRWSAARALRGLGWVARSMGDYERAGRLVEDSLAIRRNLGDQRGIADSLLLLGNILCRQDRYGRGERLLREAITLYEKLGDRGGVAWGFAYLGTASSGQGRFLQACSFRKKAEDIFRDIGAVHPTTFFRIWRADDHVSLGQYDVAQVQAEGTDSYYEQLGGERGLASAQFVLARLALARSAHLEAQILLEKASTLFRRIGNRESLALTLIYQAYPSLALGAPRAAESYLIEGLELASEVGSLYALASGVPALALWYARQGETVRAVELYAVALNEPQVGNSKWFQDVVGVEIAAVATTLPSETVVAAQERGQGRDLKIAVLEVLTEMGR